MQPTNNNTPNKVARSYLVVRISRFTPEFQVSSSTFQVEQKPHTSHLKLETLKPYGLPFTVCYDQYCDAFI